MLARAMLQHHNTRRYACMPEEYELATEANAYWVKGTFETTENGDLQRKVGFPCLQVRVQSAGIEGESPNSERKIYRNGPQVNSAEEKPESSFDC